jgi:undecaprenyl-diphosphatase
VNLLDAALLGIVQGLTEFLPISSTAHLLIVARWLAFDDPGDVFKIVIQFGSILAVMWLYRGKLWSVVSGLGGEPEARRFALMIFAAFLPAAVAGALFADAVTGVLYETPAVYATAFVVGGLIMLAVERRRPAPSVFTADRTPLSRAVAIGVCQTAALIPGVSRSGATIVGGLLAGLDRSAAAEFSFFLAMPTMAGAFVYEMWSARNLLGVERLTEIGVGFAAAFVSAVLVVGPFLRFVSRAGFSPFAWYRIVAGLGIFAAMAAGWQ